MCNWLFLLIRLSHISQMRSLNWIEQITNFFSSGQFSQLKSSLYYSMRTRPKIRELYRSRPITIHIPGLTWFTTGFTKANGRQRTDYGSNYRLGNPIDVYMCVYIYVYVRLHTRWFKLTEQLVESELGWTKTSVAITWKFQDIGKLINLALLL